MIRYLFQTSCALAVVGHVSKSLGAERAACISCPTPAVVMFRTSLDIENGPHQWEYLCRRHLELRLDQLAPESSLEKKRRHPLRCPPTSK